MIVGVTSPRGVEEEGGCRQEDVTLLPRAELRTEGREEGRGGREGGRGREKSSGISFFSDYLLTLLTSSSST